MIYVDHKITLDVRKVASPVFVRLKKKDSARRILVYLTEKSQPYQITEDCYAVFTAKKPDGKVIFNDCTIDGNTIIYKITDQTTAAVGQFDAEIKLYGGDGKLITSPFFTIVVADTVYDEGDEIESTDEFNALAALIERVQSLETTSALVCKVALPMVALEGMTVSIPVENMNRTPVQGEVFTAMAAKRYTIFQVVGVSQNTFAATVLASVDTGVQTVNGVGPDANGNAQIAAGGGGLSTTAANLLIEILETAVYSTNVSGKIASLKEALSSGGETVVVLSRISATYNGGNVEVGTAVSALTGIVVTAHYSNGSSATVTDYTLSGVIAEGNNVITVSYSGMTTTFTVMGMSDENEVTLSSISATYSGGDVTEGTALTDLTGIVVTAHYSDGSTATVTGYTLSGMIAVGENTITVSYGGKTTTFTVVGVSATVPDDITVSNGVMTIVTVGSEITVSEGVMTIA